MALYYCFQNIPEAHIVSNDSGEEEKENVRKFPATQDFWSQV